MGKSSPIDLGLPAAPLEDNPLINAALVPVYNAIRILQQVLDDAGILGGSGSTISVLAVANGGTGRSDNTIIFSTIKVTSAGGFISSDGSTGFTGTVTTASLVGKTITIKDGIITGFA